MLVSKQRILIMWSWVTQLLVTVVLALRVEETAVHLESDNSFTPDIYAWPQFPPGLWAPAWASMPRFRDYVYLETGRDNERGKEYV